MGGAYDLIETRWYGPPAPPRHERPAASDDVRRWCQRARAPPARRGHTPALQASLRRTTRWGAESGICYLRSTVKDQMRKGSGFGGRQQVMEQ